MQPLLLFFVAQQCNLLYLYHWLLSCILEREGSWDIPSDVLDDETITYRCCTWLDSQIPEGTFPKRDITLMCSDSYPETVSWLIQLKEYTMKQLSLWISRQGTCLKNGFSGGNVFKLYTHWLWQISQIKGKWKCYWISLVTIPWSSQIKSWRIYKIHQKHFTTNLQVQQLIVPHA